MENPNQLQNNPEQPNKKTSRSETGHAQMVANFDTLILFLIALGSVFNPSKAALKIPALQALLANARNALSAVNAAISTYSGAVVAREVAFASLGKLATRIINALKATDAPDQLVQNARTYVRKLQGARANTSGSASALLANSNAIEPKQISVAQLSYNSRLDHFDKLIKLVAGIPLYAPNENDLKVETLSALYNNLLAKNTAVIAATVPLSNARIARNQILYNPQTGLVDIALETKTYVKSVFGATSPQYKQIAAIEFKNRKN